MTVSEEMKGAWRFDVENAPKGREVQVPGPKGSTRTVHKPDAVIVASADGQTVTLSRWMPAEQRWNMLAKGEQIVAWMAWPSHPSPCQSSRSDGAGG